MTDAPQMQVLPADSPPLPSNIWAPSPDASIEIYWSDPVNGAFDVALMLIAPALSPTNPNILVARRALDSDTPRLKFSLLDERAAAFILWGQIELQVDPDGAIGLWLVDATYPGGHTDAARIAGPFEGAAHGYPQR